MAKGKNPTRVVESNINTSVGGGARIRWVEGQFPVELQIGPENLGETYCYSAEDAYAIGSSLVEHAIDSGYDEDTGETKRSLEVR
jgi:hypothetical protein